MARARTDTLPTPPVAPPLPKVCGTCKHWKPHHMAQAFGSCQKSFIAHGGMLPTTDLQSCSMHEFVPT